MVIFMHIKYFKNKIALMSYGFFPFRTHLFVAADEEARGRLFAVNISTSSVRVVVTAHSSQELAVVCCK